MAKVIFNSGVSPDAKGATAMTDEGKPMTRPLTVAPPESLGTTTVTSPLVCADGALTVLTTMPGVVAVATGADAATDAAELAGAATADCPLADEVLDAAALEGAALEGASLEGVALEAVALNEAGLTVLVRPGVTDACKAATGIGALSALETSGIYGLGTAGIRITSSADVSFTIFMAVEPTARLTAWVMT